MNFDFVSDWYDTIVSLSDPLGRPFHHFSILCFVCTIVSEDPGPPTSGALNELSPEVGIFDESVIVSVKTHRR